MHRESSTPVDPVVVHKPPALQPGAHLRVLSLSAPIADVMAELNVTHRELIQLEKATAD